MSPPPNLLIRGGASRFEKEHASQSVFIQRTGRCVAVWCEWQRVHTIGQYEPSLAAFVKRKKKHPRILTVSGTRRRRIVRACRSLNDQVCSTKSSWPRRIEATSRGAAVGHCAFFVSPLRLTTARCSAIGVCYIISGVPKPYVPFFFA